MCYKQIKKFKLVVKKYFAKDERNSLSAIKIVDPKVPNSEKQ